LNFAVTLLTIHNAQPEMQQNHADQPLPLPPPAHPFVNWGQYPIAQPPGNYHVNAVANNMPQQHPGIAPMQGYHPAFYPGYFPPPFYQPPPAQGPAVQPQNPAPPGRTVSGNPNEEDPYNPGGKIPRIRILSILCK